MKGLGYLLLSAGFVVAAYATALDVEHVSWALFGAALLSNLLMGAVAYAWLGQVLKRSRRDRSPAKSAQSTP